MAILGERAQDDIHEILRVADMRDDDQIIERRLGGIFGGGGDRILFDGGINSGMSHAHPREEHKELTA